jgi:hypothetical protein
MISYPEACANTKSSGMYSKKSWGGKVDPFILVKFIKDPKKNEGIKDHTVSLVVWEWKDTLLLGAPSDLPVNDVCGDRRCLND